MAADRPLRQAGGGSDRLVEHVRRPADGRAVDDPGRGPRLPVRPEPVQFQPDHHAAEHHAAGARHAHRRHDRDTVGAGQLQLHPRDRRLGAVRQPERRQHDQLEPDRTRRHRRRRSRVPIFRRRQPRRLSAAGLAGWRIHADRGRVRCQRRKLCVPPARREHGVNDCRRYAGDRRAGGWRAGHHDLSSGCHRAGAGQRPCRREHHGRDDIPVAGPLWQPGVRADRCCRLRSVHASGRPLHPVGRRGSGANGRRHLRRHGAERAAAGGVRADHAGFRHGRPAALRAWQRGRAGGVGDRGRNGERPAADQRRAGLRGQRRLLLGDG